MKIVGMILSMILLVGCSSSTLRAPAREATHGFIDALAHPAPNNELARKIRDLVDKYVDTALKASPPPGVDEITRDITEGVISAARVHAPEERMLVQTLVRDATKAALRGVKDELPPPEVLGRSGVEVGRGLLEGVTRNEDAIVRLLEQSAGAAGKALTRASGGELMEQLSANFGENAPLSQALTTSAERATSAVVRGVVAGMSAEISDCTSNDPARCKDDFVRRVSRSAAMGFTEGVGNKLEIWELILAGLGGFVLALVAHWGFKRLQGRGYFGGRRLRAWGPPGARLRSRGGRA